MLMLAKTLARTTGLRVRGSMGVRGKSCLALTRSTCHPRNTHTLPTPQLGSWSLPPVWNEPMHSYAPGSAERAGLEAGLAHMQQELAAHGPFRVPAVVGGVEHYLPGDAPTAGARQPMPFDHQRTLCTFHHTTEAQVREAIDSALRAKPAWEAMPFNDRAAIFLKAADLLAHKYRYPVLAATMLGQVGWVCGCLCGRVCLYLLVCASRIRACLV
jgi:hypothetical protein